VRTIYILHSEYSFDCGIEEGLAKNATNLSQIPTFVTAVPNGTEKVGRHMRLGDQG
jgi:hexokinase